MSSAEWFESLDNAIQRGIEDAEEAKVMAAEAHSKAETAIRRYRELREAVQQRHRGGTVDYDQIEA